MVIKKQNFMYFFLYTICIVFIGGTSCKGINMDKRISNFNFIEKKIEYFSDAEKIMLFESNNNVKLIFAQSDDDGKRVLFSEGIEDNGKKEKIVTFPSPAVSPQDWNLIINPDGSGILLFTDGINFNSILLNKFQSQGSNTTIDNNIFVNKDYPVRNFYQPGFIQSYSGTNIPVFAQLIKNDQQLCVLFTEPYGSFTELVPCQQSEIIEKSGVFYLFYKTFDNEIEIHDQYFYSGKLKLLKLNNQFTPQGEIKNILSDKFIYDYAVTVYKNNFYILSAAAKEINIHKISEEGNVFKVDEIYHKKYDDFVCNTAISITDSNIYIAFKQFIKQSDYKTIIGKASF